MPGMVWRAMGALQSVTVRFDVAPHMGEGAIMRPMARASSRCRARVVTLIVLIVAGTGIALAVDVGPRGNAYPHSACAAAAAQISRPSTNPEAKSRFRRTPARQADALVRSANAWPLSHALPSGPCLRQGGNHKNGANRHPVATKDVLNTEGVRPLFVNPPRFRGSNSRSTAATCRGCGG